MVLETKVYKQGVGRTRLPPKASGKNPSLPLPSFCWFPAILERADSFEKTWCWERLKAGGQGDDRGWDGWMASLTQWTWIWVDSGSWWYHPTISSSVVPFSSLSQSFPASGLFKWVSSCIRWPKYWSFSFNISSSSEHPGLISFRMNWLDLLAV